MMQDVDKVTKLLREETKETNVKTLSGRLKVEDKPEKAKLNPAILIPVPLKHKRFNNELVAELNATYERQALCKDDFGEYKEGVFLHGGNMVAVNIIDGRWQLTVRGDKPISMYELKAARYKFIPDDVYMTIILPQRSELEKYTSSHHLQMIEIQVTKNN